MQLSSRSSISNLVDNTAMFTKLLRKISHCWSWSRYENCNLRIAFQRIFRSPKIVSESAVAVTERLVKGELDSSSTCEFVNSKYGALCWNPINASGIVARSLSADAHSGSHSISFVDLVYKQELVHHK